VKKIKILHLQFENELPPKLVPAFRGAIIEKVQRGHVLFHHHDGDSAVLHQYPLIQYKSIQKKSAIICLGDGVGEMYRLVSQDNLNIKIHDQKVNLDIEKLEIINFEVKIDASKKNYRIVNWLALNEKNFETFKKLPGIIDKVAFLENILKSNILSFAKGIDWTIDQEIKMQINEIKDQRIIRFKGNPLLVFDLFFETNVNLPNYIGLGKSASHGYGMINSIKK
jgi:hypothetical protein